MELQPLSDFIEDNYDSKVKFAEEQGIFRQQITQWQNAGYVVHNGVMYKPMRVLVEQDK